MNRLELFLLGKDSIWVSLAVIALCGTLSWFLYLHFKRNVSARISRKLFLFRMLSFLFLAVLFPADQLTIIDYNRVVKDLNGMSDKDFLKKLESSFIIKDMGGQMYKPGKLHNFGLYLSGKWYSLSAREDTYDDHDPIGTLDVTILSKQILSPLLDITDLRKSKRIDFVGGIRGLEELERRVDAGDMKASFALFTFSM